MDDTSDVRAAPSVAAVVVTRDRAGILESTLQAIAAQRRRPNQTFVVDNASSDDTRERIARGWPAVELVALAENTGYGAGLAAGMAAASAEHHDVFWLLDDDSTPSPDTLAHLLELLRAAHRPGVIGTAGGIVRAGRIRHVRSPEEVRKLSVIAPGVRACDFTLVDGAIVTKEAVEAVGLPRTDLFMMMEDFEYTTRIGDGGFGVLMTDRELIDRRHLGSSGAGEPVVWRAYYQSRNHLRVALDRRSPRLLWGWLAREAAYGVRYFRTPDGRHLLRVRAQGTADALRNRMGRTLEPGAS